MTYNLKFLPSALEEWENLNNSIKPIGQYRYPLIDKVN